MRPVSASRASTLITYLPGSSVKPVSYRTGRLASCAAVSSLSLMSSLSRTFLAAGRAVPTFTLDTSCMVAAVCAWHEHHTAATAHIEQQLYEGAGVVVTGPALVEAYAVLTRLPAPHRLSPADAWAVLEANFVEPATIAMLTDEAFQSWSRSLL